MEDDACRNPVEPGLYMSRSSHCSIVHLAGCSLPKCACMGSSRYVAIDTPKSSGTFCHNKWYPVPPHSLPDAIKWDAEDRTNHKNSLKLTCPVKMVVFNMNLPFQSEACACHFAIDGIPLHRGQHHADDQHQSTGQFQQGLSGVKGVARMVLWWLVSLYPLKTPWKTGQGWFLSWEIWVEIRRYIPYL